MLTIAVNTPVFSNGWALYQAAAVAVLVLLAAAARAGIVAADLRALVADGT